jgi:Tol biopolymer transport system component
VVASVASSPAGGRRLAFASVSHQENLWSIALDTSQPRAGGLLTQLTRGAGSHVFPSVSADGTRVAYIAHTAYDDQVSLLDTTTGKISVLSTTASTRFQTHIRPDGSEVSYGQREPDSAYTVSTSGGPPERVCGAECSWPWDWSADRRWFLVFGPMKPKVAATIVNLDANTSRVFLERPNEDLYDFRLSPDGRWVVFHADTGTTSRTYIAPFDSDQGSAANTWMPITDGSTVEGHHEWSPDGGWIYMVSNRDGFRCVWAYPVDHKTKKPAGLPVAVLHSHGARLSLRNANWVGQGLSVARDRIVFNQGEISGNIWMTEIR